MSQRSSCWKRNIVSIVGRFYDPLGFLSPVVICFKMSCVKELWAKGPKWLGAAIDSEPLVEMPTECCVKLRAQDKPTAL